MEVTLALGIAAFCLVLLFGLLPTGINVIQRGAEETMALHRASALLADLKATPRTDASSQPSVITSRYGMDLAGAASSGGAAFKLLLDEQGNRLAAADLGQARYRVGYRIPAPAASLQPKLRVNLRVNWPAQAPVTRAQGMVETAVAINCYD